MFSGISPNYQTTLKEELFGCFKYIHIPMDTLMKMPVKDRRYYIKRHNEITNEEQMAYNSSETMHAEGTMLDAYTDNTQTYQKNNGEKM